MSKKYFYKIGSKNVPETIDLLEVRDGVEYGAWSDRPRTLLEAAFGPLQIAEDQELRDMINAAYATKPEPITAQEFDNALNALPPMHWVKSGPVESFRFMELYACDITDIYAHCGDTYLRFRDHKNIPTEELNKKVLDHIASLRSTPVAA